MQGIAEAKAGAKTITVNNPAQNLSTPYSIYTVDGTTRTVNFANLNNTDNSLEPGHSYDFEIYAYDKFGAPTAASPTAQTYVLYGGLFTTASVPALTRTDAYTAFNTSELRVELQTFDAPIRPQDEVLSYKAWYLAIPTECVQYVNADWTINIAAIEALQVSSSCSSAHKTYQVGTMSVNGKVDYTAWTPASISGSDAVVPNPDETRTYFIAAAVKSDYYTFLVRLVQTACT